MFINDNASMILAIASGPLAPVISVSCADTLRDILAGNGSGVFEPEYRMLDAATYRTTRRISLASALTSTRIIPTQPPLVSYT